MQICTPEPQKRMLTNPNPDSYKPPRYYWKSNVPMENETTYRLSYWESPQVTMEPVLPRNSLVSGDGEISDETTYNASYLGNWCMKPDPSIRPCEKQWLGRGPIQDVTTQKHDYSWKSIQPEAPIKPQTHIYPYPEALCDNTTYNLSYYQSGCQLPPVSYAPIRKYVKSDIPLEDCTTYKLSYWPNENPQPVISITSTNIPFYKFVAIWTNEFLNITKFNNIEHNVTDMYWVGTKVRSVCKLKLKAKIQIFIHGFIQVIE